MRNFNKVMFATIPAKSAGWIGSSKMMWSDQSDMTNLVIEYRLSANGIHQSYNCLEIILVEINRAEIN